MLKTIGDRFAAGVLILILSPLFIFVSLGILIAMGRPVLFRQRRPGLHGKLFTIYKFRTMSDKKDAHGALLSDDLRLNGFGKVIRSSSLDELPQLFNVLKGEMSFVGPRPLLEEYLPLYSETQNKRHLVKPGITGWAQVNGRNQNSWEETFEYDIWYVEHRSCLLDLKILWMTFLKVIKREGVSSKTSVTKEKFKGNA